MHFQTITAFSLLAMAGITAAVPMKPGLAAREPVHATDAEGLHHIDAQQPTRRSQDFNPPLKDNKHRASTKEAQPKPEKKTAPARKPMPKPGRPVVRRSHFIKTILKDVKDISEARTAHAKPAPKPKPKPLAPKPHSKRDKLHKRARGVGPAAGPPAKKAGAPRPPAPEGEAKWAPKPAPAKTQPEDKKQEDSKPPQEGGSKSRKDWWKDQGGNVAAGVVSAVAGSAVAAAIPTGTEQVELVDQPGAQPAEDEGEGEGGDEQPAARRMRRRGALWSV